LKIQKSELKAIIIEEFKQVLAENKQRKSIAHKRKVKRERDRKYAQERRKNRIRSGVFEEDTVGNPSHAASDGRFTSKDKAGCLSKYFSDGSRASTKTTLDDKDLSGRGTTKDGRNKRYRCHDNKMIRKEELEADDKGYVKVKKSALARLIQDELIKTLDEYLDQDDVTIEEEESKTTKICRQRGLRTFQDFLQSLNAIEKSKKGKLNQKPKDK